MKRCGNQKGFTLVELIVVIAIVGVLTAVFTPSLIGYVDNAKLTADKVTVGMLNRTTTYYGISMQVPPGDIFAGYSTDEQRMAELVNEGFLDDIVQPKLKGAAFAWLTEYQVWTVFDGEELVPLSPLGSTFVEISSAMIAAIDQRFVDKGRYGRNWGEFAYTDLGLDPQDWQDPIAHIYYKPGGSLLRLRPEEGYVFVVNDINGNSRTLSYSLNWDLLYNAVDEKWYYHSISEANVIDISTLEVKR